MKVKLGDVGMKEMSIHTIEECFYQIRNGANIKQGVVDGGYPITRIETTANDKFNRDRMGYAGITDIKKYESYVLEDGDLLMSHINSVQYLGRTVLYEKQGDEKIIHGMNLLGLKANRDILKPAYARYYFYSRPFREQVGKITKKSVNQASFAVADLKKIKIKVPDLAVQEEVVEILNRLNCVIEERQQELQKMDELIRARFVEMFGNPLDKSKANMYFVECVEFNPKKSEVKDLMCETVSFVPMECVGADGSFKIKEDGLVKDYYKGYTYFKNGDVLLAKITPCFENGKVAIAENCTNGIGFGTTEFHVSRPIPGVSNSHWIKYMLKNERVHELATINMTGSAGQKRIQTPFFEKLKVYLPPIELQNQFADFVAQIDKSKLLSGCRLFHSWEPENRDKPKHVGVPQRKTKVLRGGRRQQ